MNKGLFETEVDAVPGALRLGPDVDRCGPCRTVGNVGDLHACHKPASMHDMLWPHSSINLYHLLKGASHPTSPLWQSGRRCMHRPISPHFSIAVITSTIATTTASCDLQIHTSWTGNRLGDASIEHSNCGQLLHLIPFAPWSSALEWQPIRLREGCVISVQN